MSMSENRKEAFEIVYSLESQNVNYEDYKENVDMLLEEKGIHGRATTKFIKDIVYATKRHGKHLKKQIESSLSEKWSYDRVSKINIVILEIAIFEMIYLKTPYKVAINEAVELAKAYADAKAPAFINGVLASIVKKNNLDGGKVENE